MTFSRTDTSVLGRWWWTIDRWALAGLMALIGCGIVLALAASPPAAERIGLDAMYFVKRHLLILPAALLLIFTLSLLTPVQVRRLAVLGFAGGLVLLVATLVVGAEINGAQRWLNIAGFSLQPSEFIKPTFAIVTAWLLAAQARDGRFPARRISIALLALVLALLLAQPDLGQAVMVTAVWLAQLFLAGLSMWLVAVLALLGIAGLAGAYVVFPHVASRIDRFLDPSAGDTYQIGRSLKAFTDGGLFGRGPGQGQVKFQLPDAHADFVFAVAGEEFGLFVTLIIVALFAAVVLRGFTRAFQEQNLFVLLAVAGLLIQFGLQALINMGSSLSLIPTKGITLPFISYGGSSLLAIGMAMGMALALTRRRVGAGEAG